MSWTTPFLIPLRPGQPRHRQRVVERIGGGLFAIDRLAGLDGAGQQARRASAWCRRRRTACPRDRRGRRRDRRTSGRCHVRGPAPPTLSGLRPTRIGSGISRSPFASAHAAIVDDRLDRADQVLVQPHPPGDAMHDDADAPLRHAGLPAVAAAAGSAVPDHRFVGAEDVELAVGDGQSRMRVAGLHLRLTLDLDRHRAAVRASVT